MQDDIAVVDVAIIPGNTVQRDGTPSPRLAARLDRGIEVYRDRYVKEIIVSGGFGEEGYDEATAMKRYLVGRGVPEDHVITDSSGITTYHTAVNAARIMKERGWSSAMVISQYFHIPRTRLAMGRCGISPTYSAHANYFELRDVYSSLREVAGYIKYMFRAYD